MKLVAIGPAWRPSSTGGGRSFDGSRAYVTQCNGNYGCQAGEQALSTSSTQSRFREL
jgi:hypothetical protein